MKTQWASLAVFLSALSSCVATESIAEREPCIVLTNGYEAIDDSPAINDAISTCGNGGTIILPANNNYSIHTSINFQACHGCTLQIEGYLLVAVAKTTEVHFNLRDARDVTIRSLTGQGFINSNAYAYWTSRFDSGSQQTNSFFDIMNARNIVIDNIAVRDVPQRFYRAINSTNLSFSNLKMDLYGQWAEYPRNAIEAAGIEIGNSSDITISDVSMTFRGQPNHRGAVGMCIPFDSGSSDIVVRNVVCNNAVMGIIVNLGSYRGPTNPWPRLDPQPIRNISISNFLFDHGARQFSDGQVAPTGFVNEFTGTLVPMSDITWDNVTIVNTNVGVQIYNCYQKIRSMTSYPSWCAQNVVVDIRDVWFRNYHGNVGGPPTAGPTNNMTVIEIHVENWPTTV